MTANPNTDLSNFLCQRHIFRSPNSNDQPCWRLRVRALSVVATYVTNAQCLPSLSRDLT